jgi:hypothetical protein
MDRRSQTIETLPVGARGVPAAAHNRAFAGPGAGLRHVPNGGARSAARVEFVAWLLAGRAARGMTREQIAQVTRIQLRIIERLEDGRFDELPADVFVRGFIRSYARCVGLSVDDALGRYGACGFAAAPVTSPSVQALALLDSMAPLSGNASSVNVVPARVPQMLRDEPGRAPAIAFTPACGAHGALGSPVASWVEIAAGPADVAAAGVPVLRASSRATGRVRDAKGRFVRGSSRSETDAGESGSMQLTAACVADVAAVASDPETAPASEPGIEGPQVEAQRFDQVVDEGSRFASELLASGPLVALPSPPRPVSLVSGPPPIVLVIDDDDPEGAERERAPCAKDADGGGWRSFFPPVLLDQGRNRQGGLTLAVIILLIVATLTLSYLMRRPSSTGEGVAEIPAHSKTLIA